MRPMHELEQEAVRAACAVAGPLLGHPVQAKLEAAGVDFHGTLFRHVYAARLSLWKPLEPIDVLVDADGRVAGYLDVEARRGAAPGADTAENHEIARGLVADEELLPAHCSVWSIHPRPAPEGGELLVVLVAAPGDDERHWIVEVNPARRQVVGVRPVGPEAREELK
jgi:hypothetical protein